MEWYIKLHRKILEWEWYDDPNTMRLFLHILLTANYTDKNWRGQLIKRWQLLTSISHLALDTWLSLKQVRLTIDKLKRTNEVASYTTHQYTILEVVNYELYQWERANEETNERQTEGKRRANEGQQLKKDNKDKKDKKERIYRAFAHLKITEEEFEKLKSEWYTTEQIDGILDEIQNYKKNTKYSSLLITSRNWLKRRQTDNKTPSPNNSTYDKVELL